MASRFVNATSTGVSWGPSTLTRLPSATPLTLSCWARRNNAASNATYTVMSIDNNNASRTEAYLSIVQASAGANVKARVDTLVGGSGSNGVVGTTQLEYGPWYHICASVTNSAGYVLYVNGVQDGTVASSMTMTGLVTLRQMTNFSGSTFRGWTCEACVWNEVLTLSEVKMLAVGVDPRKVRPAALRSFVCPRGQVRADREVLSGVEGIVAGTYTNTTWGPDPLQLNLSRRRNRAKSTAPAANRRRRVLLMVG